MLRKIYRTARSQQWIILEKDVDDEIIFKTDSSMDRLMLELMARGGMRIGEVLKLRVRDVDECRLHIQNPKSGRPSEIVFIPQKVADRLKDYIREVGLNPEERIFPVGYTGASQMVQKAGRRLGIEIRQHRPTLLSDNGPCYVSKAFKEYLTLPFSPIYNFV